MKKEQNFQEKVIITTPNTPNEPFQSITRYISQLLKKNPNCSIYMAIINLYRLKM